MISSGYIPTNKAVQPKETVLLDIDKTEEELLNFFSKSTRYNIKYAKKKEIEIKIINKTEDKLAIKNFYKLLKSTQERKYFLVPEFEYYENIWKEFSRNNKACIIEAYFKDTLINSIFLLHNNYWASSVFSASSREFSNLKATYLARWESIKYAIQKGCKIYDFFGATSSSDINHPFYFTSQFKLGFGRETTKFAGTFEIILNKVKYNFWKNLQRFNLYKFYEESFLNEFKKLNNGKRKQTNKTT